MFQFLVLAFAVALARGQPVPDVVASDYDHDGYSLQGYFAEPNTTNGPFPTIVFIPDWDGVNLYEQQRATMVAKELGWASFAADIYGKDLHEVSNQTERIMLAGLYRSNASLFASRIQAAVDHVRGFPEVDGENIAIVGFCLGGTGVLQYAMEGVNDVKAIVSIHGGLRNLTGPNTTVATPRILILSGGEDDESSQIMDLEKMLNTVNSTWEITRFSGIEHAWTVFGYEGYNAWADSRTWDSMVHFLKESFDLIEFQTLKPANFSVTPLEYMGSDGIKLRSYVATPNASKWSLPAPAVVIIPDWDGVNDYEKERAELLAAQGYVAVAADIFGADLQENLEMDSRIALVTKYRFQNASLYQERMVQAVDQAKALDSVDGNNIAMIGYCFGGSGIVHYAFSGRTDVKLAAAFHGGLNNLTTPAGKIHPYTLILSGGNDGQHGNQTELENALNAGNASWEISRWSGVDHGFTSWYSTAYNLNADIRSWEQALSAMSKVLDGPKVKNTTTVNDPTDENDRANTTANNDTDGKGDPSSADDSSAAFSVQTPSGILLRIVTTAAAAITSLSLF